LYQLSRRRTAFAKSFVWWVKDALDLPRMREAARTLVGMQDFARFAERDDDADERRERSTVVLVERFEIVEDGALVLVMIEGSHFLWKMVRRLVGALVEVGRGEPLPSDPARVTAPPSGLFLERVFYAGDDRDVPIRPATPCR
jgi:tRNA pseudouridine38-40 synthase